MLRLLVPSDWLVPLRLDPVRLEGSEGRVGAGSELGRRGHWRDRQRPVSIPGHTPLKVNKPPVLPLFETHHKSRVRVLTSSPPQSHSARRISSAVADSAPGAAFQGPVARQSYAGIRIGEWSGTRALWTPQDIFQPVRSPDHGTRQPVGPAGTMMTGAMRKKGQIRADRGTTGQRYMTMCGLQFPAQPPSAPRLVPPPLVPI